MEGGPLLLLAWTQDATKVIMLVMSNSHGPTKSSSSPSNIDDQDSNNWLFFQSLSVHLPHHLSLTHHSLIPGIPASFLEDNALFVKIVAFLVGHDHRGVYGRSKSWCNLGERRENRAMNYGIHRNL